MITDSCRSQPPAWNVKPNVHDKKRSAAPTPAPVFARRSRRRRDGSALRLARSPRPAFLWLRV